MWTQDEITKMAKKIAMTYWSKTWKKEVQIMEMPNEESVGIFLAVPRGKGTQYEIILKKGFVEMADEEDMTLALKYHLCQWMAHQNGLPYYVPNDMKKELDRIGFNYPYERAI